VWYVTSDRRYYRRFSLVFSLSDHFGVTLCLTATPRVTCAAGQSRRRTSLGRSGIRSTSIRFSPLAAARLVRSTRAGWLENRHADAQHPGEGLRRERTTRASRGRDRGCGCDWDESADWKQSERHFPERVEVCLTSTHETGTRGRRDDGERVDR
jgi:hypothetical protein